MDNVCPICNSERQQGVYQCPVCGFHYTDGTQKFTPVGALPKVPAVEQEKPTATLTVVRGPQTGNVFVLDKAVSSVGRKPQCDIFLNDMTVSRDHAFIAASEKGYVITDRKSYNGVWVNNQEIEKKVLVSGDLIQIGNFCLLFEM